MSSEPKAAMQVLTIPTQNWELASEHFSAGK